MEINSTGLASKIGYSPLKLNEGDYVWQEAFADAIAYHYVLDSNTFQKLRGFYSHTRNDLYKHYGSYEKGMRAFNKIE